MNEAEILRQLLAVTGPLGTMIIGAYLLFSNWAKGKERDRERERVALEKRMDAIAAAQVKASEDATATQASVLTLQHLLSNVLRIDPAVAIPPLASRQPTHPIEVRP